MYNFKNETYKKMSLMDSEELIGYLENVQEIISLNDGDIFPSLHEALNMILEEQENYLENLSFDEDSDNTDDIISMLESII